MKLRIGTRGSALALWQSRYVATQLTVAWPGLEVVLVEISSAGDRITDLPLSHVEGTGFFTAALERALLSGEADVAVHSYKDLPVESSPELTVAAIPPRDTIATATVIPMSNSAATAPSARRPAERGESKNPGGRMTARGAVRS